MRPEIHFLKLLVIFGMAYFGVVLSVSQLISQRVRGRKFVIRLGTPWKFSNAEQRWNVLLSFVSFIVAMGVSFFVLDFFLPLGEVGP